MAVPKHKKYRKYNWSAINKIRLITSRIYLIKNPVLIYNNLFILSVCTPLFLLKTPVKLLFDFKFNFFCSLVNNYYSLDFISFSFKDLKNPLDLYFFLDQSHFKKVENFYFNFFFSIDYPTKVNNLRLYYFFFSYLNGKTRELRKKKIKLTKKLIIIIFYFLKKINLLRKNFKGLLLFKECLADITPINHYINLDSKAKIYKEITTFIEVDIFFKEIFFLYFFNYNFVLNYFNSYGEFYNYFLKKKTNSKVFFFSRLWGVDNYFFFDNKILSFFCYKKNKQQLVCNLTPIFFLDFCQR